ncbi:MAG: peptidase M50, partial [bacterium]|nr:peptidase M50 [bacterium]
AFAAKHFGAPVHEIGIMFLVGMPVPYVDASATAVFPNKHHRMVVGAAGVVVELALASLALCVWLNVSPGIVKLAAFQMMAIGGVSTLLFNGNPLIKFDGYYVLSDAVEIPNLATRANKYLRYLVESRVLGLPERRPLAIRPDERHWLASYAVLAFVYRTFLTVTIALFVSTQFYTLGIALAIWSIVLQTFVPAGRGLMNLVRDPRFGERPLVAVARGAGAVLAILVALFALPLPSWTLAEGVVWLPEQAQVRAGASGVVTHVLAQSGSLVERGAPLLEIRDELLIAEVRVLAAREREARARLDAKEARDRVGAEIAREELHAVRAEYARARDRLGEGTVRAPEAGRFVLPRAEDTLGRYLEKGVVVGYLDVEGAPTIRVVVPQDDVARIRADTQWASVRFMGRDPLAASVEREVPQATDRLPSMALGAAGGGRFAVDQSDQEGMTALESLFQFDLRLAEGDAVPGIGSLAAVRFDHRREPVGFRLVRAAQRLWLGRSRV